MQQTETDYSAHSLDSLTHSLTHTPIHSHINERVSETVVRSHEVSKVTNRNKQRVT
jgi:hypothetical protein